MFYIDWWNEKYYRKFKGSDECKRVLDAIDGFKYHISGRMFYWSIGRMNGSCPWPEEFQFIEQLPYLHL